MSTLIIGVGNEFRRDDRIGLLAARKLAEMDLDATVVEASGEGAELMDRFDGFDRVVLIDATRSGAAPGSLHRLDASKESIPSSFFNYSTHAFSVAEAVEMARVLGRLPDRVILFGIEGGDFSTGEGLSAAAASALETMVETVAEFVRNDHPRQP